MIAEKQFSFPIDSSFRKFSFHISVLHNVRRAEVALSLVAITFFTYSLIVGDHFSWLACIFTILFFLTTFHIVYVRIAKESYEKLFNLFGKIEASKREKVRSLFKGFNLYSSFVGVRDFQGTILVAIFQFFIVLTSWLALLYV